MHNDYMHLFINSQVTAKPRNMPMRIPPRIDTGRTKRLTKEYLGFDERNHHAAKIMKAGQANVNTDCGAKIDCQNPVSA